MNLFPPGAPWTTAQTKVGVFRIDPQFAQGASDADLSALIVGLQQRNIQLALEFGLLTGPHCGTVEGYCGEQTGSVVARIQSLGGTLSYVRADEPLWFGNQVVGTSISALAADIANQVTTILATFPNCKIGESEPLPGSTGPGGWASTIGTWQAAYKAATGVDFAFEHNEVIWPDSQSVADMLTVAGLSHSLDMRYGIIYDGNPSDSTGLIWTTNAEKFFSYIEQSFLPDDAALETFAAQPNLSLPETTPGTMTSLVLRYILPETTLTAQRNMSNFTGTLTSAGVGLAAATVTATRLDTNTVYATTTTDGSGAFTVSIVPVPVEFDYAGDAEHRLAFTQVQ
jgi:hypothetical protein